MELESIRYFIKVIEQKSFTKAAQVLNIPKSTLSKSIARLESELGAKLMQRTTRSLTLTDSGNQFFNSCQQSIHQLEQAQKIMFGADKVLAGPIRLTAPEDLGSFVIAPAIAELSKQYSKLIFDLNYTDQMIDLVKDGYDLAIRIGTLNQSQFKAKKLGEIHLSMVASPKYLKTHSKIHHPEDLKDHECISYRARLLSQKWVLHSKSNKYTLSIKSRITSNQMTSLLQMAQCDAGIALVPTYLSQSAINEGVLVPVLPEWKTSGLPVYLLAPSANLQTTRIRLSADFIAQNIKKALELVT